jgi:hypothetical protein
VLIQTLNHIQTFERLELVQYSTPLTVHNCVRKTLKTSLTHVVQILKPQLRKEIATWTEEPPSTRELHSEKGCGNDEICSAPLLQWSWPIIPGQLAAKSSWLSYCKHVRQRSRLTMIAIKGIEVILYTVDSPQIGNYPNPGKPVA